MPSRAEAVAQADQLAIAAASKTGMDQAAANRAAGDLRRRSFRAYHVVADAREAIEQYKLAARHPDSKAACDARVAAFLLQAEIEGDLVEASAGAYAAARRDAKGPCVGTFNDIVHDLVAFRPSAARLAEIDESSKVSQQASLDGGTGKDQEGPVVTPAESARLGPARIEKIESFGARDAARVVIHLSAPAMFQVGHIPPSGPGANARLYLDLTKVSRGNAPTTRLVGGLVERVRVGAQPGGTRVVLDLSGQVWRRVFYLPEPFRIVADLAGHPPALDNQGAPDAGLRSQVQRVVLDPGHGGHDPGAIGPGGLKEKDVTLDIAHRVAPVLARELGVITMITRDDDRYVALEERAARANAFHADLFVSIHCNASESPASRGIQSYILDVSRDENAQRVAARENAVSAAAVNQLGNVVSDLRLGHLNAESLRLAQLLQRATLASLSERYNDTPNGGVKSAGFFVLLGAEMPSVLFEASFISNPVEESRLQTADYRQKLADGIANAVRAYRQGH